MQQRSHFAFPFRGAFDRRLPSARSRPASERRAVSRARAYYYEKNTSMHAHDASVCPISYNIALTPIICMKLIMSFVILGPSDASERPLLKLTVRRTECSWVLGC